MNPEAKKIALRMISSGLYILTSRHGEDMSAATVSWVNQASFTPPLIMMGIRTDSHTHAVLEAGKVCAIHFLGRDQQHIAEKFFKPVKHEGNKIGGMEFETKITGAPILKIAPAYVECKVVDSLKRGDHSVFVVEVLEAEVRNATEALGMRDTPWHYGG
ncbi:MAG: flavin reductase family protein [Candidatus Omnitrophica bacterium]|nr:flavin reductase family protein [Candidatus Omnitrophota bacterium]